MPEVLTKMDMQGFIIGLVIVSVTLIVGVYILATIQGTFVLNTIQYNAAGTALTALNSGTSWLTILVVVGFAVLVLVLLNKGLGSSATGGNGQVY